jgi:hypothetical protein
MTCDQRFRRARYTSLIEINTRVLLADRSTALGRSVTLDDVTESVLDGRGRDFEFVWLLPASPSRTIAPTTTSAWTRRSPAFASACATAASA